MCPAPRQGHMVYANRTNMMNGSTKGSHKVWMGQQQRQQHNQQLHRQLQPHPQQQWGGYQPQQQFYSQ
eukprot:4284602-Ditylum_brightwellii.AAC.1